MTAHVGTPTGDRAAGPQTGGSGHCEIGREMGRAPDPSVCALGLGGTLLHWVKAHISPRQVHVLQGSVWSPVPCVFPRAGLTSADPETVP